MKKVFCLLLALVLVMTTGCAQIAQEVVSAVEETVEAVTLKPTATPKPEEEEERETSSSVEKLTDEVQLREYLETLAEDYTPYQDDMNALEWEKAKNEWVDFLVDVKRNKEDAEIFCPVVEYQGVSYKLRQTITEEELRENIPELVEGEGGTTLWDGIVLENDNSTIRFELRPWENFLVIEEYQSYLGLLDTIEYQGQYLAFVSIRTEGVTVDGLSVGDPREAVFDKFPMIEDEGQNLIELYYYNGRMYAEDEFTILFRDFQNHLAVVGSDEGWEEKQFNVYFQAYLLEIQVFDEIDSIIVCDGRRAILGS